MGKKKHVNDFTVDTNSQCFICFKKTHGFPLVKLKEAESDCSAIHSLQYLSRYLKMDMRKMFHEQESIPPHLLAQVQKSRLKVELCEDCGRMNEKFSKQYKQLEKIEMEVKSSVELIHRKFQESMETNKTAQFQNLNADAIDFNGKMDIANALRAEATEKCKLKIERPSPLIKIKKMSRGEVLANQRRNKLNSQNPFPGPKTKPTKVPNRPTPSQNDMEENDYFDDSHVNLFTSDVDLDDVECDASVLGEPTTAKLQTSMQGIYSRGSLRDAQRDSDVSNAVEGKRYTINPETGKLKCNLCSMEFKQRGFKYHYQSIHLGIKYKCNLCEKEFSVRPAFNLHHKKIHKRMPSSFSVVTASEQPIRESVGVGNNFTHEVGRQQCDLCALGFGSADDLQHHYVSAHPDVKYRCKLCYKEFSHFSTYQQHGCN